MVHSGGTPHRHEPKLHERRFIYGYGLDGSDFPCYLMWPERVGREQSVALLDSQANWWCKLTEAGYMCPLDLHHLMDAFRITAELSSAHLREIAVQQLGLLEEEVTADCQVSMNAARRKGWLVHEEQPVDLVAPEADVRNVPEDVISVRGSEVDDASTVTSSNQDDRGCSSDSSDDSSTTDEPAPSVASEDHNMLVQAYGMTQNHFTVTRHALVGGSATLHIMDIYPMQWPLAKLKIPIDHLIQRVERLLTGFANEISAAFWRKTPMQMPSLTVGKRANTSSTGRWIQSAFSRPVNVGSDSSRSIFPLQKLSSLLSLLCPEHLRLGLNHSLGTNGGIACESPHS